MKRCSNLNCESTFLFGNDKTLCPFCHSRLVDSIPVQRRTITTIHTPDMVTLNEDLDIEEYVPFINHQLGRMECHGRIVEIDHHEMFNSKWHKFFNSLLRGEPYQFAHQTMEYTIRVENITDGYPMEITDFCLFGNYLGRLQVGDEVFVKAKNLNDRRVVKSIYNQTTSSMVKPGLQLPAGIIRGVSMVTTLILIALICEIVWLFKSGAVAAVLIAVVVAMMPIVVVCVGIGLLVRSVFPKRKRRR